MDDQSLEMDPYEFRNEQINNLITDEDAEYKRAILQLIFIDDIATLTRMLNIQGQNGNDDVYEQMDPNK